MLFSNRKSKSPKRRQLAHILASFVIWIHAYEKWEGGHPSYVFFIIAGFVFLAIALLHSKIETRAPWIDGAFVVIEAALSFVIAYDYFHLGKKALPVAYALLGVVQLFIAFYKSKKGIAHHRAPQA